MTSKYNYLLLFISFIVVGLFSCNSKKHDFNDDTPNIVYYSKSGLYQETTLEIKDQEGNNLYRLIKPQDDLKELPIVIWGNGTGALPDDYDEIMRHLAQWGFLVIDTYSENTGTGKEMDEAIQYLINENKNSESILFNRLDLDNMATVGHSQGSTGAINCQTNFANGDLIKSVVSIALPALKWADEEDKYDTSKIKGSFLTLGGNKDSFISPFSAHKEAIDGTNDIPALSLILKSVGHNEIQGNGGNYRGILTAWLHYQLKEDPISELVFKGSDPEIEKAQKIDRLHKKNF